MKKFVLMILVVLVVGVIGYGTSDAASFKWSDSWNLYNVTGTTLKNGDSNNKLTTGVFYGPIAEVKNSVGKSPLAFGGLTGDISVDSKGNLSGIVGVTAVTFFDNMFQFSVVADINNFQLSDPKSYMLYISAQPLEAGKWVFGKGSALIGALAP